jgi:hypothetical protein
MNMTIESIQTPASPIALMPPDAGIGNSSETLGGSSNPRAGMLTDQSSQNALQYIGRGGKPEFLIACAPPKDNNGSFPPNATNGQASATVEFDASDGPQLNGKSVPVYGNSTSYVTREGSDKALIEGAKVALEVGGSLFIDAYNRLYIGSQQGDEVIVSHQVQLKSDGKVVIVDKNNETFGAPRSAIVRCPIEGPFE